jgi:hypothetical protein
MSDRDRAVVAEAVDAVVAALDRRVRYRRR